MKTQSYTVIGCFDNEGRDSFAAVIEADSAANAELQVGEESRVVLVLEGVHELDPQGEFPAETVWTVAAFYVDNDQRYAASACARNAAEAAASAHQQAIDDNGWSESDYPDEQSPIVVVGALLGSHECADTYACDEYWACAPARRPD